MTPGTPRVQLLLTDARLVRMLPLVTTATAEDATTTIEVAVQQDHLQRLARQRPVPEALAEIVWNALDADAKNVDVEVRRTALDGIESVTVSDDGHGLTHARAVDAFEKLGNSWKKGQRSPAGRELHGQAGQGRFSAFALAGRVEWSSLYVDGSKSFELKVVGNADDLRFFKVTGPTANRKKKTGTVVVMTNVLEEAEPVLAGRLGEHLLRLFAPYLKRHSEVSIRVNGEQLQPDELIVHTAERDLPNLTDSKGRPMNASITVIEWEKLKGRQIVLCDEKGVALATRDVTGVSAKGFQFTAYVRSARIRELHADNFLDSHDLHRDVYALVEATKVGLREHFKERAARGAREIIEQWKEDNVYPFDSAASTPIEEAERQIFDVVALNLHEHLPAFAKTDSKARRLSFQLLRTAIEQSPVQVRRIVEEVLELSPEKRDELVELIDKTSLTAVINASKVVLDRLEFLSGLEHLLYDAEGKQKTRERSQLHRLLAKNTWIFGEQFNLTNDDEALEKVLAKHLRLLGRDDTIDSPVQTPDGKTAIVDLMLSRRIPMPRAEMREHLVIELKRPSQKVDVDVVTQIRRYAFAVSADERFAAGQVRWSFWAVSNEMDDHARHEATQSDRPEGVCYVGPNLTIYLKTWNQIIDECRGRLEFFRKSLDLTATRAEGLMHLRKFYKKHIPDLETTGEKLEP